MNNSPAEQIKQWVQERRENFDKWDASLDKGYGGTDIRDDVKTDLINNEAAKLALIEKLLEAVEECPHLNGRYDPCSLKEKALADCAKLIEGAGK